LALIDAADHRVRSSPLLVVPQPEEHGEAVIVATGQLAGLCGTRGEARARALWLAAADISERLFRPFVEALWKLAALADGYWPSSPPPYGALPGELQRRLPAYAMLVEPDCAHVRNAVAHGHVKYFPEKRAVQMSDGRDGRITWQATMRLAELEAMARRMLDVAGLTYQRATHLYLLTSFLGPLMPLYAELSRALRTGEQDALKQTGRDIRVRVTEMFAEILQLRVASPSAQSRTPP
jgi:hypothetical protein